MSQVAGPYGLVTSRLVGDLPFSSGMHTYPLTAANAGAFYFGDPVGLSGGQPVALTASPTPPATYLGAATANNPIGIFYGCSYLDPRFGFVNAQYLVANATTLGYTNINLKIMDWPYLVMQVQANGSVALNQIGLNAALVGPFGGGAPPIGNSVVALNASTIGTAVGAVRIYDFINTGGPSPGVSSQPGDPFTDVLVTWCPGVHRFTIAQGL